MKMIKLLFAAGAALLSAAVGWADDGASDGLFAKGTPTGESVTIAANVAQSFTVTASGSYSPTICQWMAGDESGNSCDITASSDGLTGTFTPPKAGNYFVVFMHEGSDEQIFWMVTATGEGGGTDDPGTSSGATVTIVGTPTPYFSTVGSYASQTIACTNGEETTLSVVATPTPSDTELEYRWLDTATMANMPGTDSTTSTCTFTYEKSSSETTIVCYVYEKGKSDESPLGLAEWHFVWNKPTPVMFPSALSNAVAYQSYTVTFTVPNYDAATTVWQAMPAMYEKRDDNSFAEIQEKSTVAKGATQITSASQAQSLTFGFPIGGYYFSAPVVYANEGRIYQQQQVKYQYYSGGKYWTSYYNKTFSAAAGISNITFEEADDGVFFIEDGLSAIFRWKGTTTTYVASEGGTGASDGSTGGTTMTPVTKKVNFAIVLSSDGRVTYSYGDCEGLSVSYQNVEYPASTANNSSATTTLYHESSETASAAMQDIVFGKSTLPSGMYFSSNDVLTGTPNYPGTYTFAVKAYVSDAGQSLTKTYTLTVDEPPPAEIVVTPSSLPHGKVGEEYEGATFSVINAPGYSISIDQYAATRQANSFDGTSGTKLNFTDGQATQEIPFAFPCVGTGFTSFTFDGYSPGFNSSGSSGYFNAWLFQSQFTMTEADDGVYYSTDGSTKATFRWKGNVVSGEYDETTETYTEKTTRINASVTLYSDGRVVYAFGDCGGLTLVGQGFYGSSSTGGNVEYQYGDGGKGGTGSGDGKSDGSDGEVITTATQDLVVSSCFPDGLAFSGNTLSGTPTKAGTYNLTVNAYICSDGSTISSTFPLVIESAGGGEEDDPSDPTGDEPVTENHVWYVNQNSGNDANDGLSVATAFQNVYAVETAIPGDEVRILSFNGEFTYANEGIRYIATNGTLTTTIGTYGAKLQNVELAADGTGFVDINVNSIDVMSQEGLAIKIARIPHDAKLEDYDTASSDDAGGSGADDASATESSESSSSSSSSSTSTPSGKYQIVWDSSVVWADAAYLVTNDQDEVWIMREVSSPEPVKTGQLPAAAEATSESPLELTEGMLQSFHLQGSSGGEKLHLYTRWVLDDVEVKASSTILYYNLTPSHDLVDDQVHHLVCYGSNEYHADAIQADWYFTVAPAPLACSTTKIREDEGEFDYDLAKDVVGGKGTRTFAFTNEVPEGVTMDDNGVIHGTMGEDVRGKTLSVVVTDEDGVSIVVDIALRPRMLGEEDFYLVSCTPDVEELDVYLNENPTFTIVAQSDTIDESDQNYLWFWDDTLVNNDPNTCTLSSAQIDVNKEDETFTLSVYGSATYQEGAKHGTLLKQWRCTICNRDFGFKTTSLPDLTVGQSMAEAKAEIQFYLPYGTTVSAFELLRGELPPGMHAYGTTLAGSPRASGVYTNVLQATCSNGEVVAQEFVMTVNEGASANVPAHAWYVDATGAKYGENDDWCVTTVNQAITRGLMNGDTVYIYPGTYDNFDFFSKVDGATVHIMSGAVVANVNAEGSIDASGFVIESGASLAFAKGSAFKLYGDDAMSWGYPVRLAKVPSGMAAEDFVLSGFTHPEYSQTAQIDDEGWLYVTKGLWQDTAANGGVWHLDLPDKVGRRDAVIRDYAFTTGLEIASAGVIPGTITFAGTTTLGDVSLTDAGKGVVTPVIASDADLTLTREIALYNAALEIRPGATIRTPCVGFVNCGLALPKTTEAKVNVVLTSSLPQYSDFALFRFYFGADDPSEQFNLTVPDDQQVYRWVRWYGRLMLTTCPESGEGDPGNLVWTTAANLGSVAAGTAISQEIAVSGATEDLYGFELKGNCFEISRAAASTFKASGGDRELLFRSIRKKGSAYDDTVDIGFAFPFCGKYYSSVKVESTGFLKFGSGVANVRLLGNSLLWTLDSESTFCDVFVSRTADSFTVRYGEFGSVTLTPDGVVRMAFGKDASYLYANQVREPICCSVQRDYNHVEKFEIASNDFANQPDVIFTPSGVPNLAFSGKKLTGTLDVPGTYNFDIKVTDSAQKTRTQTFTLEVAAEGSAPQLLAATAPEVATDGIIRLPAGEKAVFTASVSESAKAQWTVQYGSDTVTEGDTLELTAPASRAYNQLARVILDVVDAEGKNQASVRKSWWVAYTTSFACNAEDGVSSALVGSLLPGDELVLASGTYKQFLDLGNNPVSVTIRSATGNAADVIIDGENVRRCFRQAEPTKVASVGNSVYAIIPAACRNARLENVMLVNGRAEYDSTYLWSQGSAVYGVAGGAVFGGTLVNCDIASSTAVALDSLPSYGGGVYGAKLTACVVAMNAADIGGGASNCELYDCTVADNVANTSAGGVDGQCYANGCIIRYNARAGEENEYEPTYRINRLVADVPTIVDSFTSGDPLFCNDYTLATGSPAEGKGAYPTPRAGDCLVRVEIVGGGTVEPYDDGKVIVASGGSQKFAFAGANGRKVSAVYVDGAKVADEVSEYTLSDITANHRLKVVFAPATLTVNRAGGKMYYQISAAVNAAADGDTIEVDEGTYEPVFVNSFAGNLTIRSTGSTNATIISGGNSYRCFTSVENDTKVKLIGFTLKDGYAQYSDRSGFGGGAFGGELQGCIITNCFAYGGKGGGAYQSRLVNCRIVGNRAGVRDLVADWFTGAWGGGAYGGYLYDCEVTANRICATNKPKSDGAGVYDAEVRNSFVWGNYANIDATEYERTNNAKAGSNGVLIYTQERVANEKNRSARKTPIAVTEKVVYATQADAIAAAPKQVVDIPSEVARTVSDVDSYADLFEIKTVEENGKYVNKPGLKESVKEQIQEQIASVLTEDDSGNARTEFNVQKMEKTLTETTPGLYYALEFSTDLSSGSFVGERHLATGSGSVKLSATSVDTATSGFWRVNVYTTPDGD